MSDQFRDNVAAAIEIYEQAKRKNKQDRLDTYAEARKKQGRANAEARREYVATVIELRKKLDGVILRPEQVPWPEVV
jgi:hypothetical protein